MGTRKHQPAIDLRFLTPRNLTPLRFLLTLKAASSAPIGRDYIVEITILTLILYEF